MAFPVSPTNGSTTTVNGIVYLYSSADNAWTRFSSPPGNLTVTGNLISSGNLLSTNLFADTLSVGGTSIQQDVLNLNNNNLYGVNTIRINDPGTSEGIAWEGGSGWNIYESPNDLSNNTGNLQIVLAGTRVFTVDTNQTVNIPASWEAISTSTGALTVGGGVGIAGNLWVGGNIYASNLISISSSTLSVTDPLLYLTASSPSPYNYDIGFYSHFVGGTGSNYQHTGFSRNYLDNNWTLFSNVIAEPGVTIDWTDANIIFDPIKVGSANIANTTVSTSTTTGALVVAGGVGIGGNIYTETLYTNTGIRWAGNGNVFSSGTSGTVTYTASASAPITPNNGDFWYKTTTGFLFQYQTDGVSSYWFDVQTQAITGNAPAISNTYTNSNVEAYIGANIGSYQLYANANAATQATSINAINAAINNILSPFLFGGM
jgi:hypothetical protein